MKGFLDGLVQGTTLVILYLLLWNTIDANETRDAAVAEAAKQEMWTQCVPVGDLLRCITAAPERWRQQDAPIPPGHTPVQELEGLTVEIQELLEIVEDLHAE